MTAVELRDILSKVEWNKLSDEELSSYLSIFSFKEAEIKWILNGRRHKRAHLSKKK